MGEWFYNVMSEREDKMKTTIERKMSALATLLEQMNVPDSRKDISKQTNVRWLLRNLAIDNKDNPMFETTQSMIIWVLRNKKAW